VWSVEDRIYANFTLLFMGVGQLFVIDPRFKRTSIQFSVEKLYTIKSPEKSPHVTLRKKKTLIT